MPAIRNIRTSALIWIALAALSLVSAHAATCGQFVSGNFVLDTDLICSTQYGLVVTASNTVVDLNGHSLTCVGSGYHGSCQPTILNPANTAAGIVIASGFTNVTVRGPGKINGWATGIFFNQGHALHVDNVEITGPLGPANNDNTRGNTTGIFINSSPCSEAANTGSTLTNNAIHNQLYGIAISQSGCVAVMNNTLYDNNGHGNEAYGLRIESSQRVVVNANRVTHNGNAGPSHSGIMMLGATSYYNVLANNTVDGNCGDGIQINGGGHDNMVFANEVLNNPPPVGLPPTLACPSVPLNTYWDLHANQAGSNNNWNPNNRCHTQSAGIPNGVCNPGE